MLLEELRKFLQQGLRILGFGWSDVKDTFDFKDKIKKLGKLSEIITLVTEDVVNLYLSIRHEDGLETLRERLSFLNFLLTI